MKGRFIQWGASASAIACLMVLAAVPAMAQDQAAASAPQADGGDVEQDIVVTGFRSSLSNALALKKQEAGLTDTILAEDIGKFPDSNLAESMQRVPGVALARGDGGEGRQITVRGLPPLFTRVLIGGMEANSQVAQTDINNVGGGSSRSRAFDFSAYPSEIFSSLTVRKSSTADVEEGSLGATVELRAPRPFDFRDDFVLSASAKAVYNDLSEDAGPRLTGLVSKKFGSDGQFGVLLGVAYAQRNTRDEGYAPSNILPATSDQGFCSPIGYAPQNPANNAVRGSSPTMCGTGVPRTSDPAAYDAINSPNVFLPRLPRYERSDQHYTRLGVTGSLQWQPDDRTDIALDGVYTRYKVSRDDFYLMALSFGRGVGAQGKPETSVLDVHVTPEGSVDYGLFNGVDVVSQVYRNDYTTTLAQGTLTFRHDFSDRFHLDGQAGLNQSRLREPIRANVISYANNVNGFSYDIRDSNFAIINYGFDVADPNSYVYSPNTATDGTATSQATANRGGATTDNRMAKLNATFDMNDWLKFRVGGQYRRSKFSAHDEERTSSVNPALPAGTTLASISQTISGFGKGLPDGVPNSWTGIDWDKFVSTFDFYNNPAFQFFGPADGRDLGRNYSVSETEKSAFAMAELDKELGSIRVRGDIGLRYVHTNQRSFGYLQGSTIVPTTVNRSYDAWLPSLNLSADVTDKLTLRLAAAKVLARPDLPSLSPGTSVTPLTRAASVGSPNLDPIRAKTLDLSAEWYFSSGSLLSVGYFYKKIGTYIQTVSTIMPFSQTGLPVSLLDGTAVTVDDLFTVSQQVNTPGGPLRGFEVNYQQQFKFLPGMLSNLGALFNYTRVTSNIQYILNTSSAGTVTEPLIGLSKNQANATLYYEDSKFSIRGSLNYRSGFIRSVPSVGTGSDIDLVAPTTFVDAAIGYSINDHFKISLTGSNLTDEHTVYYVDSKRKDVMYNIHSGRTFEAGISYKF